MKAFTTAGLVVWTCSLVLYALILASGQGWGIIGFVWSIGGFFFSLNRWCEAWGVE